MGRPRHIPSDTPNPCQHPSDVAIDDGMGRFIGKHHHGGSGIGTHAGESKPFFITSGQNTPSLSDNVPRSSQQVGDICSPAFENTEAPAPHASAEISPPPTTPYTDLDLPSTACADHGAPPIEIGLYALPNSTACSLPCDKDSKLCPIDQFFYHEMRCMK